MEEYGRLRGCRGRSTFLSSTHLLSWRPLLFLVPRQRQERSTEEETPIARAVSGSLCVCARSLLITGICSEFRLLEARPFRLTETETGWLISITIATGQSQYGSIDLTERSTFLSSTHLERVARSFLWARPLLFLVPSTEEETPIARAVSGSLCVCELCSPPTFVTDKSFCSDF